MDSVLVFAVLLAGSVWVGGLVAIATVARAQLDRNAQVSFFRALGRRYGIVAAPALAVALGCGAALLGRRGWDLGATAAALVAVALVACTVAGVLQARAMTRLRGRALERAGDPALARGVRRGAARALVLRGLIGALTVALVALASALAT